MRITCIKCLNIDAVVCLNMTGAGDTFQCTECQEAFDVTDVRAAIEAAKTWEKLLPWIEQYPK